MLQARMFAYPDAARYRLGANYQQLPTNAAKAPVYSPFQREGAAGVIGSYGAAPNYVRSSFQTLRKGPEEVAHDEWVGRAAVESYTSEMVEEDYVQPRMFWEVLGKQEGEQEFLVKNLAGHLGGADERVQEEAIGEFFPFPYLFFVIVVLGLKADGW